MKEFRMIFGPVIALALLVSPVFAGSGAGYRYLALGDSISFGYHPLPPPPQPIQSYVGYPEILDPLVPKQEVNASCPGQTSASFLHGAAASNTEVPGENCEVISQPLLPGWKAAGLPLHNPYTGTQADFAVSQLQGNKSIDLVTISLGGNDLLFVQFMCGGPGAPNFAACVQVALPAALFAYGNNLGTILTRIRQEAKYTGTIVLVKYFATSTDPLVHQAIGALNQAMAQVASHFPGVKLADAYTAFQIASIPYGGDPCKAGLLVRLTPTTCDVHPTLLGQRVIATTVLIAIFSR
jgi:lysophospholipase L1-like esterase